MMVHECVITLNQINRLIGLIKSFNLGFQGFFGLNFELFIIRNPTNDELPHYLLKCMLRLSLIKFLLKILH